MLDMSKTWRRGPFGLRLGLRVCRALRWGRRRWSESMTEGAALDVGPVELWGVVWASSSGQA